MEMYHPAEEGCPRAKMVEVVPRRWDVIQHLGSGAPAVSSSVVLDTPTTDWKSDLKLQSARPSSFRPLLFPYSACGSVWCIAPAAVKFKPLG